MMRLVAGLTGCLLTLVAIGWMSSAQAGFPDKHVGGYQSTGAPLEGNFSIGGYIDLDGNNLYADASENTSTAMYLDEGTAGTFTFKAVDDNAVVMEVAQTGVDVTGKFILQQEDTPAAPTFAFGDEDSGFHEQQDDVIEFDIAGATVGRFYSSGFSGISAGQPLIQTNNATATGDPNINPNVIDTNTGLGQTAVDCVTLIAGGADGIDVCEGEVAAGETQIHIDPCTFANLGTPGNGTFCYCSDCTKATPCAGSGNGALAKRLNSAWDCD